jgi:hypothetical protein
MRSSCDASAASWRCWASDSFSAPSILLKLAARRPRSSPAWYSNVVRKLAGASHPVGGLGHAVNRGDAGDRYKTADDGRHADRSN